MVVVVPPALFLIFSVVSAAVIASFVTVSEVEVVSDTVSEESEAGTSGSTDDADADVDADFDSAIGVTHLSLF